MAKGTTEKLMPARLGLTLCLPPVVCVSLRLCDSARVIAFVFQAIYGSHDAFSH
jgi:hypothetical protein